MLKEVGFTEARANLSALFDNVINREQPLVINRKRDKAVLIEGGMMEYLLSSYHVEGEVYRDEDGSYTVSLDSIDIVENAQTKDQAIEAVIQELKVYAQEYFTRLSVFLHAPNRKIHLPYVLRVLLSKEDSEIKDMLVLRDA